MKANELQVGSWVMYNEEPCQVEVIYDHGMIRLRGWCECVEIYELHHIPITTELLEKNGFEKEGVIELYNLYAGIDHRVTIHNDKEYMNSNNEWYVHVDSEDYSTIAGCELTYLHEFQHLLTLCKINFEFSV